MRLCALFAMAVLATNALNVQEQEETQLEEQTEDQVQELENEGDESHLAALSEAMAELNDEQGLVETSASEDEEKSKPRWTNGKWNLWIKSAYYDKRNVLKKVLSMYAQGKRFFPATNQLFGDPARGKVKTLTIKYRWNGKWYTKTAREWKKNSFVRLPEAWQNRPKPKPRGIRVYRQNLVSAKQNDCGKWCKYTGSPLRALRRRPNSDYFKGKSCTHSATTKAGNWLTVGIKNVVEITNVKVLNRGGKYKKRLLNASVFAGWKLCGTYKNHRQLNGWMNWRCPSQTYADKVSVVQPTRNILTVCGLQVWGRPRN